MRREAKIGVFCVAMILAAWAGIRFLKGFDIFSRNVEYYASYDQINGVQAASPIMMKGIKIGSVTDLQFDPQRSNNVVLQFTINRKYRIPSDSEAKIFSNGLMGAKAIEIKYGTATTYLKSGDTLRSGRDLDLMDMAGSELEFFKQKISQVTTDLSRTMENLNSLMEANAENINGTMSNLNNITDDVSDLLRDEKKNLKSALDNLSEFSVMLGENSAKMQDIIGNVSEMTGQFAQDSVAVRLSQTLSSLDAMIDSLTRGNGSIARLINDPGMYESVEQTAQNLSALLADLKKYPGRYVHLSLFGRNPEKMKAKADKRAAREAARQERDSLKKAKL